MAMVGFTPHQGDFQDDINVGKGFEEGSPDGHDPLVIARHMASKGIALASSKFHPEIAPADRRVTVLCGL
jgi:hypothetical protein